MTHLIITIEIPVNTKGSILEEYEAQYSANEAYKAARKALPHWTPYNKEDFTFEIKTGKFEGFSNYELLSHSSGGGGDECHNVNLSVCRECGEIKIQGWRNKGTETHRFCEEFSIYYPDAVAAIVKNCNYMNMETDDYLPFVKADKL